MAEDRGFGETGELQRRFEETFDPNSLVPLPATQMMKRGAPPVAMPQMPNLDNPFRFTQGQERPGGVPQGTVPQGPTTSPGLPPQGQPQQAQPATPTLDDLLANFRSSFILGDPSSDLSNPDVHNRASDAFNQIIAAMGGNPNLRGEIGDARFTNRLQEFIGKGDTLDQSGRINIGNGVILNSLRDLADFNQPTAGGFGGGGFNFSGAPAGLGGGNFGDLIPGTGKGHPGVPAQFVGGRAAGQQSRALQRLASGGGIDPNLMFQVEKSLRESAERTRAAETEALTEGLASRRITGGGVEAQERGLLSERLAAGINTGLRDFGTSLALQGSQNQLAAAQSLAQNDLTRRGQNISMMQSQMANALQQQQINNNFALGQGGLALQNLALNTDFVNAMIGNRIDLGSFMNAVNSASSGDVTQLLGLLLGVADSISNGAVDGR